MWDTTRCSCWISFSRSYTSRGLALGEVHAHLLSTYDMAGPAWESPKRRAHFVRLIGTVLFFSFIQYIFFNTTIVSSITNRYVLRSHRKLKVAVLNTNLSHDEVLVPLLDSWMRIPHIEVETYQISWRFDMQKVIKNADVPEGLQNDIYAGEFKKIGKVADYPLPDIVISTTCLKDGRYMNETMYYLLENHHTHFFCVFHHADQLENRKSNMAIDMFTPFVRAERIDFIALSPHVAEYAKNDMFGRKWDVAKNEFHHPPVHVFPPVFNANLALNKIAHKSDRASGFSIQGEYEKGRDYPGVFEHLQKFIKAAEDRQESADATNLHLVGFGKHPEVPQDLQNHVIFDERLDYTDFYTTLMQSDAVLTAFALEDYYVTKASSTVPASLIAGTPLVADKRLLQTYKYLDESIVWMQEEGESEMDTVGRVLAMSRAEKHAKKTAVKAWNERLVEENRRNVREWTAKAVAKFPHEWYLH